ncbi:MAG: hypothetical protein ABW217_23930 [Polyangiaceae bacterium]
MIMKSLFSVLGLVVLVMASGCGDDDLVVDPPPPPSGDAGPEPVTDGGLDAGELLDATVPDIEIDAGPIGDAAIEVPLDADIADADVDAGDAQ